MTTTTKTPTKSQVPNWVYAAIGVVVIGGVMWAIVKFIGSDAPRLNDNAVVLTKYIRSGKFDALPFDQQRQFYKVMDDRDAEIDEAFKANRLSESEYRTGLEAAWLGKHINRTEKYFSLPAGQARVAYIDKLVEKKERKKAKPDDPNDIDPDETAASLKVEKWPPAARAQWDQFHDTYRKQKKAREKELKDAATKPAKQ